MVNKKTNRTQSDDVPTLITPINELVEQDTWTPGQAATRYVVVRGGLRVSDKDYPNPDEQRAIAEKQFWQKVIKQWPDGTKVEIVQFDKKKHRIW